MLQAGDLHQLEMPTSQHLKRFQCRFLSLEKPLVQLGRFFLHSLQGAQVVLNYGS